MILMASLMPVVGALCDAAENSLQITMLLGGADDGLAQLAFDVSTAKTVALTVGGVLLAGALMARVAAAAQTGAQNHPVKNAYPGPVHPVLDRQAPFRILRRSSESPRFR